MKPYELSTNVFFINGEPLMTARSSLTLCSRLTRFVSPEKINQSLRRGSLLFDCAETHAVDALVVRVAFSKSLADLIVREGEGATV